jgi:hypothetical protein
LQWAVPRELFWAIIGALTISVIALWPSHYPYSQAPQINSEQQTKDGVGSDDPAQHGPAAQIDRRSYQQRQHGSENTSEIAPLGIKPGEWLLSVVTLMLWGATVRLVRGSEKAAQQQLRAYLVVEARAIEDFEARLITKGHLCIRNVGQTPPHDVIMATGVAIAAPKHIPVFDKPSSDKLRAEPNARRSYFANQIEVIKKAERTFSQREIDSVIAGESRLCVGGRVYYKDVFNNEWHTDFLYVYSGPETRTMIPDQYQTGNEAT